MSVPTVIGRYRMGPRLGAGAFAVVWLGHDELLDTPIAIKVLAENWIDRVDLRDRFLAEAQMLRRAASSRIVEVFDVGELPDGRPYFVMEYADLGTLSDRLAGQRLPLVNALRTTAEIARGAAELHQLGIVHRDLKPSNVLMKSAPGGRERLLIADLGVAKNLTQGASLTMSVGSAGYMAPEQSALESRVDLRADVYSLGALGFRLITGVTSGPVGPVLSAVETSREFPESVRRVLQRALEIDPQRRWADANIMAEQLDALADHLESGVPSAIADLPAPYSPAQPSSPQPALISPPHPNPPAPLVSSRAEMRPTKRLPVGRAFVVAAAAVAVLGGGFWFGTRDDSPSENTSGAFGVTSAAAPAASPAVSPAVSLAASAKPLPDGHYDGLLVGSAKNEITVDLIDWFVADDRALAACRQDLGRATAGDVCRFYYYRNPQVVPQSVPVAAGAAIQYVAIGAKDLSGPRSLLLDVAKLSEVSQPFHLGKVFKFEVKGGRVRSAAQFFLYCGDSKGIAEWTSPCVPG